MIAAAVSYRLRTRNKVEVPLECVKDAKSAIRFLRKNAERLKVDPDRIVAAGGSAGGQLAAATAMITAREVNDSAYDLSISCVPNAVVGYNPWFRCQPELNPADNVVPGLPPTICFLGSKDPLPVPELKAFHDKMAMAGNASELHIGIGAGHGFCNGRNPQNPYFYWALDKIDRFLVEYGILTDSHNIQRPEGLPKIETEAYRSKTSFPKVSGYDFPVPAFDKGTCILFQGDSITDMGRVRSQSQPLHYRHHHLGHGYPFLLAARMDYRSPELDFTIVNRGISGNILGDLRKRWQTDALNIKPDVLSVLIGINNVSKSKGLDTYEADYRHILDAGRKANPDLHIVLLDPFVLKTDNLGDERRWAHYKNETARLRAIVAKLATDYDAVHIKTQELFDRAAGTSSPELWLWDGIHPTERGQELIARHWLQAVSRRWPQEHL